MCASFIGNPVFRSSTEFVKAEYCVRPMGPCVDGQTVIDCFESLRHAGGHLRGEESSSSRLRDDLYYPQHDRQGRVSRGDEAEHKDPWPFLDFSGLRMRRREEVRKFSVWLSVGLACIQGIVPIYYSSTLTTLLALLPPCMHGVHTEYMRSIY
jgi:hypothetical protein